MQGNVYDDSNTSINCKFQAFSTNISRWSEIRDTEYGQFNVNFGDGDLNTQSGSVSIGHVLLVVFWTGGEDKSNEHILFSAVAFSYNGNDNIVQDIQLLPPHSPSCTFNMVSNVNIETQVTATSTASTTIQWEFSGKTFYQRRNWYGQTIFGFLNISYDEFNFGDGYNDVPSNSFSDSGTYSILHLVESTYGLSSECNKEIRVHWRTPTGSILFSDIHPLLGDTIDITADISDIDSRIYNIKHIFDNILINENTNMDFMYSKVLDIFKSYQAKQEIYWNDGFDNLILYKTNNISMQNVPPSVDVEMIQNQIRKEIYTVMSNVSDSDGTISNICWELYYETSTGGLPDPFFKCDNETSDPEYNLIYRKCDPSILEQVMVFAILGKYKIVVTATDNFGDSTTDTMEFIVEDSCISSSATPDDCPECPDVIECPECPECPEQDCDKLDDAIRIAIEDYKRTHPESIEKEVQLIVVQDGRAAGSVSGEIEGQIDGNIKQVKIIGNMDTSIEGTVAGGSMSGTVGGAISGRIKSGR